MLNLAPIAEDIHALYSARQTANIAVVDALAFTQTPMPRGVGIAIAKSIISAIAFML